jgi:small subunit ribosomal protein S1
MSLDRRPADHTSTVHPPIEPDESYWSALLDEGEYARGGKPASNNGNGWDSYDHHGSLPFSLIPAASEQDWKLAKQTYESDGAIELDIIGYNRGGLLVTWHSLRGFVPASQLVDFPVDVDDMIRRELLAARIGTTLRVRIIELDAEGNRLILSERAAQSLPGQRASVLSTLRANTTLEGIITNLCDFGAFVDLGGVEGLIHISELSWGRVAHPRDILSTGQKLTVHILSVDADEERIALSIKRLQPDPWQSVEERYEIGQIVEGTVTNVVDFGAFACIEEGLEGLIHISELAEGQFLHPRAVVQEGAQIKARILNIDGSHRRLGLSLRGLNGSEESPGA